MNSNRKNFIQGVLTGILLSVMGVAAFFYGPSLLSKSGRSSDISFETALSRIQNKDIKALDIRSEELELTDKSDNKYSSRIDGSDETRRQIYEAARNSETKITLESASSGAGWIALMQFLPLVLLGMFTVCTISLAILAWKAISNKKLDR